MKTLLLAGLMALALAIPATAQHYKEVPAPEGATCASAQERCDKGCKAIKAPNCQACIERYNNCRLTGQWPWDHNQTRWVGIKH